MFRRVAALVIGASLSGPVLLGCPASAAPSSKPYDFNGDGYADLAVAASDGALVVLPGSSSGLSLENQVIAKSDVDVSDYTASPVLASGDFDGNGFADLAVGYGSADVGAVQAAGAVRVLYGSSQGLSAENSEVLVDLEPQQSDSLGYAVSVGDFDGDRIADLAVGVPFHKFDRSSGYVLIHYGTRDGLTAALTKVFSTEVPTSVEGFGVELALGDLDQDGRTDLVVGAAGGDGGAAVAACYLFPGEPSECTVLDADSAYQGLTSVQVANVSGTPRPEVVLGVPDRRGDAGGYGRVEILSLSGSRQTTTVSHVGLTQSSKGVPGAKEKGDHFGSAVALGDLDHDGFDDLVVGASGEDVGGRRDAGTATVVYGGSTGYRRSDAKAYGQATKGVPGKAERGDVLGTSIALLDHDGDSRLDLTLGVPGENTSDGALTTLRGSTRSFTTKGSRTFGPSRLEHPVSERMFGIALGG